MKTTAHRPAVSTSFEQKPVAADQRVVTTKKADVASTPSSSFKETAKTATGKPTLDPGAPASGKLFVGGPGVDDPIQGKLGDGFVLASLASVAAVQPDLIKKAITDNGDGTYAVTLHLPEGPRTVQVKASELPMKNGTLEYGHARNAKELWPAVLESAYRQVTGKSYEGMARDGNSIDVLGTLTGRDMQQILPRYIAGTAGWPAIHGVRDQMFADFKQALAGGDIMVAHTASALECPEMKRDGLVPNQAYSLLAVEQEGDQRFAVLRNPFGFMEAGDDGKDDGTFKVPFHTFVQYCGSVSIASATKVPADLRVID